jgi:DNA-binding NarL/FixJ family response regulator
MGKRVMLVTERPAVDRAVREALRHAAGLTVAESAGAQRPIAGLLAELQPDLVLLVALDAREDVLRRVREVADHHTAPAVVLTDVGDAEAVREAFQAGADVVMSPALNPVALACALRELARGTILVRSGGAPSDAGPALHLTAREAEILALAAQGLTNVLIARELWITEQTVKFHLSNCYRKLGVRNRTQASRYAYLHALVGA